VVHELPRTLHVVLIGAQVPFMQLPLQHSPLLLQAALSEVHVGAAHTPIMHEAEQQSPSVTQAPPGCRQPASRPASTLPELVVLLPAVPVPPVLDAVMPPEPDAVIPPVPDAVMPPMPVLLEVPLLALLVALLLEAPAPEPPCPPVPAVAVVVVLVLLPHPAAIAPPTGSARAAHRTARAKRRIEVPFPRGPPDEEAVTDADLARHEPQRMQPSPRGIFSITRPRPS